MAQTAKRIGITDIKKFIILNQYHQRGWPTGQGSVILLSKVKIYYTKSRKELLPNRIYRHRGGNIHPERDFLKELRREIERREHAGHQIEKIHADLIQNLSPCSNCADAFVKFKNDRREREGIKFSLKIKFANIYCHWDNQQTNGLNMLLENGVALKLLQGEDDWKAFLNDTTFVELTEHEKTELLDDAKSEDRKENEKEAMKIFNTIGLGNTSQPSGK